MIQIVNPQISPAFPSSQQQMMANYYLQLAKCMDKFSKSAYSKEVMGHIEVQKEYDKMNNIHYLAFYLMFIAEDIQMDIANGIIRTQSYYDELYKIDCIRKAIQCTGCSVEVAIDSIDTILNASLSWCGDISEMLNYFTCN